MADAKGFLTGGEQTTINATITELFPALAFNTGNNPKTPEEMQQLITEMNLQDSNAQESFVAKSNVLSAKEYISQIDKIKPTTRNTKLQNSIAILDWINQYDKDRKIQKVVWGYRQKPKGVPDNHSGDIFLIFKNTKIEPNIIGISLKAGTKSSKEPKLNSYVGTTLRKPMWQKAYPNAMNQLKDKLWSDVYSKVPNLPKTVKKDNWLTLSSTRQIPNKILQDKILKLFKYDPLMFDALYSRMNKICRNKLCDMINGNLNATKEWIEQEFRLEKKDVKVPMVLVKAIGNKAESQSTDPLRDFLPSVTSVNAYLDKQSVQEWFIDLMGDNGKKMTLTMTIRSDSEYREAKQKGKLGAFMMLKLLYRG
tara:strand:+ start:475 stop:1572 length:1098 start_codon:yes stop_codon:yes gene_type:complete